MKNKTEKIKIATILKIYGATEELIRIETTKGSYFCYDFTLASNEIRGKFWQITYSDDPI